MSSVTKQVDHELIGCCASRIIDMATEIERTHAMGGPHGEHDEPWTLEFHQVVASIYLPIIPAQYARELARSFEQCSTLIAEGEHPDGVDAGNWMIVAEYVGSASQAICSYLRIGQTDLNGQALLESTVPGVFPYGKVAPLVSPEGAARLRHAAQEAQKACEQTMITRPPREDVEIIRMLSSRKSMIEIGHYLGYSERTLHRRLKQIWKRMGVDNYDEALIRGGKEGWL